MPEEGTRSFRIGDTGGCELPCPWVLGTEVMFSVKAVCSLYH